MTAVLAMPALLVAEIPHPRSESIRCGPMAASDARDEATGTSGGTWASASYDARALLLDVLRHAVPLGQSAMLPLVGSDMTMRSSHWATALVAACIIGPAARRRRRSRRGRAARPEPGAGGRCCCSVSPSLPLRGALLAWTNDPYMIVAVQTLDGISGAVHGCPRCPLALADVSRGTGRFNLAQGIVGSATGIGATLSTIGAGYLGRPLRHRNGLRGLAAMAVLALAFCWSPDAGDEARR